MSWTIALFAIVAGVLIAGWVAYERARPSARMVAVVGTLAALAALGRDAFAALPEVKPVTAMTLVAGYALGPLAGFAVGAIGMLASNIALGEGPYTPWQMMAWGTVGLVGAALGRLSGRRMGRGALALAAAASAMGAKEVMNLYEWTLSPAHTPAAFVIIAGRGLPFDATDAVASFLFGLAFGPELARALCRVRARMTVTWETPVGPLVALALLLAAVGHVEVTRAAAPGSPASQQGVHSHEGDPNPLAFLESAQNRDGGFGGARGEHSEALFTAWAALGVAAAGRDPAALRRDGHSVLDAIRRQASTLQGPADIERTILALHACGAAPGDLVTRLLRSRAADGSFGGHLVNVTSFAVLALRAAGRQPADPAVRAAAGWLEAQQDGEGGFAYAGRAAADVDDTAAAVQALIQAGSAAGRRARPVRAGSPAMARAVSYLLAAANRDGGFPQQPGMPSNAQSTAWAVQALIAAGRDPARVIRGAVRSPLAYLESLMERDGGVRYSRASAQTPVWVTAQSLMALARRPLPIAPPRDRLGAPLHDRLSTPPHDRLSAPAGATQTTLRPVRLRDWLNAIAGAAGMLMGLAADSWA